MDEVGQNFQDLQLTIVDFLDLRAEDVEKYIYMTPEGRISDASGPLAVRSLATKFGVMHFGRGKFFGDLPRPCPEAGPKKPVDYFGVTLPYTNSAWHKAAKLCVINMDQQHPSHVMGLGTPALLHVLVSFDLDKLNLVW